MPPILGSLSSPPRVAVVGATGGIGAALVRCLADPGQAGAALYALSRHAPVEDAPGVMPVLDQVVRTCAIELARRNAQAFCVALHPGTVDTALSRPLQANVPPGKLFSVETAARQLLQVIDRLPPGASGQAFAWDGERLPF